MRISSRGKSEDDFILRLTLIISNMPFYYKRVQFPMLHLSFAMSIDKCQDQTSKAAGLQWEMKCFLQPQLCVGTSTVGSKENLFSFDLAVKTPNIV